MSYTRIFFVSLVVLGAALIPSSASAATISDLIAQATKLQAQIAQLKAQQVLGAYTASEDMEVMPVESEVTSTTKTTTAVTTPKTTTTPLVLPGVATTTVLKPTATTPVLTTYTAPIIQVPSANQTYKRGDRVTIFTQASDRPAQGSYIESRVSLRKAEKGYVKKSNDLTTYTGYELNQGGGANTRWETNNFVPGVYDISSRLRACSPKGCSGYPVGAALTDWSKPVTASLTAATTTGNATVVFEVAGTDAEASENGRMGIFEIEFDIYADDGDIYVPLYTQYQDNKGAMLTMIGDDWEGGYTADLSVRGASVDDDWVRVREGDSETFILYVNLDPKVTGDYGVRMDSFQYAFTKGGTLMTYALTAAQKKEATTDEVFLVGDSEEEGIEVQAVSTDEEASYIDGTVYGEFEIDFDVTAFDKDLYIPTNGVTYDFPIATKIEKDAIYTLTSTGNRSGSNFIVEEDETERFTLHIHMQPAATGSYAARLKEVLYKESSSGATKRYEIPRQHLDDFTTNSLYLMVGSTTMKGAFDSASLNSKSDRPTMTGTAGVDSVSVNITLPGNKVYGSGLIPVTNGKWSHTVTTDLRSGYYAVSLTHVRSGTTLATSTLKVTDPNEVFSSKMSVLAGVYQGSYKTPRVARTHPEGTVTVRLSAAASEYAQPLVLSAYEPTNWIIERPNGARISKIITTGYYNQRVSGAPAGVPIEHFSVQKGDKVPYAYESGKKHDELVKWLKDKKDLDYSGVFYNKYSTPSFDIEWGYKG